MYAGIDGFLGTRASLMLDVVFLAMFLVVPVMGWSIYLARFRGNFALHKRVQLTLGAVLLVTVAAFEADIRIHGWKDRALESPYYGDANTWGAVFGVLYVHLAFSTTTALLWVFVIVQALRKFDSPPVPNEYSARHRFWARLAAADMVGTAVTGWIFYWLAFVM